MWVRFSENVLMHLLVPVQIHDIHFTNFHFHESSFSRWQFSRKYSTIIHANRCPSDSKQEFVYSAVLHVDELRNSPDIRLIYGINMKLGVQVLILQIICLKDGTTAFALSLPKPTWIYTLLWKSFKKNRAIQIWRC